MTDDDLELLTKPSTGTGADAAAQATRRVISALLHLGNHPDVDLDRVTAQLNELAEELEACAEDVEVRERLIDMWSGEGFSRHDPVTGSENSLAPPVSLYGAADGTVTGTVTMGFPYQGPPGLVHGGVSALLLDHVLGAANGHAGRSGMTASLTLTYHRPTPLFTPLNVTARQVSLDGRKIRTEGRIEADGQVTVSAEGLFIEPRRPMPGMGRDPGRVPDRDQAERGLHL